jgi:hypothetical protein
MSSETSAEPILVIPFGDGLLALTREQYEEARWRGRELSQPQPTTSPAKQTEILDAAGMERHTGIPASWWAEQARRNKVPHIRAGKYVRFDLDKVLDTLEVEPRHADRLSVAASGNSANQPLRRGRYQSATKIARG